ncbi:MAG: Fe-S cluster assembly protein SufB [Candidatus Izemoplasmatales bacterium]|jgi:Fe-S cluster assembly protein SufB|nr:Fe-S cluster assembly protein SufB [Candidatus Izemoplasmatales bacterium]MDD4354661.1 Fe-S cluster assembly protein SufB [Candidatus Izemoplasmatales bacterium]MDD4988088.1 Fe-S cluster assembly protein SufB [Candidatus Izemoplasmatales bacterium]MDY0373345.1 Fe-S cluster assembly protein SufB [Candidatus Izemoplasmatales bacterium]NLF48955.1 Fe-S cluster assembly protein SufB [Acholeplasmataceae bacterium]
MTKKQRAAEIISDYKYGFHTDSDVVVQTPRGLSEDIIRQISGLKQEPEWMLENRLKAYQAFCRLKNPDWGPDLSFIDFSDIIYFIRSSDHVSRDWENVPKAIKDTFEALGIPEAEQKYLSGVTSQFESEAIYHQTITELEDQGVIFLDTDSALKAYPDLFREYFGKAVSYMDNKYAALNTATWSGGSFIYVPKGVSIDKPLQSYFRINTERMGQFERTLIIVDDEASLNYVEGCTAPIYSKDSLHAAVVEIFVKNKAYCRYSTIQNWSNNIINLVTKRAIVETHGHMEWIDGNIGSGLNMKYPTCILKGDYAKGTTISIAFASKGQYQDTGAKMIHLGKHTASTIISKSIATRGGKVNYRGLVSQSKEAEGSRSKVECDTILIDRESSSDTLPTNIVKNFRGQIEHEATVSKVSEEQLFYLMSRGLTEAEATEMIVMGFIEPFARELPMEYAVELNQLIKLEMTGSIG